MSIDSSDSSGSSSGSLSSGSSSDLGSNNDEEALMDRAESELYHQRIARAWEIVNRRQAELDMEEGIETGSAELDDIEMGGTGAGLADQDVQDDAQDGQDSQDGQDG